MKRHTIKKYFALILFLSASFFIYAFDWPLREGRLAANFGSSDMGIPLLGNFFTGSGSVFPVEVGELIFVHDPENPASRFPSPLGSWMALDHGDDMISLYARYNDRGDIPVPTVVETTTVLASTGISGWSEEDGLYFAFFDRKERRWVNPSIIIQGNISNIEDTILPVIRQVELRSMAGTSYNPALIQRLPQGIYTVYIDAWDNLEPGGEALAPNRINSSLSGAETGVLSFEILLSREGKRMVYRGDLIPAFMVYDESGYSLGEIRLTRGQAVLVIEARDIADNVRSVSYRLNID